MIIEHEMKAEHVIPLQTDRRLQVEICQANLSWTKTLLGLQANTHGPDVHLKNVSYILQIALFCIQLKI